MPNRFAVTRWALLAGTVALGAGCAYAPLTEQAAAPAVAPASLDPAAERLEPLETRHFELSEDQQLLGDLQVIFARYENTFTRIARQYDIGYEELRDANPDVDQWLPGEGTPVYLPTLSIIPDAPREGIVLNLPSMRLLFYDTAVSDDGEPVVTVTSHPIGIGREGWATPTGDATVTQKARDPVWYVPASVRAEHEANGDPLPAVVPPGPDNPLGHFAIALSLPGYLIHGTNKPAGVGMRVSHGCVRLYPEDIEALFERVPTGTPVTIVDQPVLAGWRDGQLYLEVHRPLTEDERDLMAEAERVLAAAIAAAGADVTVDPEVVARIVTEQRGMPFPVLQSPYSLEHFLAEARIVENVVAAAVADAE